MKNSMIAAAGALLVGALMTTGAMASEATASVNVRSGPSTSYPVVDTLYAGEDVNIGQCTSGFCYITHSGPDGWVSSRYLSDDDSDIVVGSSRPNVSFSFSFGRGNGFSFGRGRGDGRDLVCLVTFYKRSQVEAGADVNVQRAQVLPRRQAERMDGPNDRQAIFDYGTNQQTRETCRYLDRLN